MSQLSEIRTAVQANWPTNYHSTFLDDTKTDEYINDTQRWVCRGTIITPDFKMVNYNFRWMKAEATASTIDGQQRYALPTATSTILRYKKEISLELVNADDNRVALTRRLKVDIERDPYHLDTTDTGTPKDYAVDQSSIWLFPIPDHSSNRNTAWTLNFEYYGYLADLSADEDTNALTNFFAEILEYGATEKGFRYGQDYEQAEYYKDLKEKMFFEMLREDQSSVYANLETGMMPMEGSALSEGSPGYTTVYNNPTPYD